MISGMVGMNQVRFLPESRVVELWRQVAGRPDLATEEGFPVQILNPGRLNHDSGPDFLDALILNDTLLMRGGIEIHTAKSAWWQHGHHLDHRYNSVVLHVVLVADSHRPVTSRNGRPVSTISLARYGSDLAQSVENTLPCQNTRLPDAGRLLDRLGDARFNLKTGRFAALLKILPAEEALYRGVMGALGYSKNKAAFTELAERVPLQALLARETVEARQSLLFSYAGMLPSQRGLFPDRDSYVERLETYLPLPAEAMYSGDWRLDHVRGANSPVRRMAAVAYLADALFMGTAPEIAGRVAELIPAELIAAMVVPAEGYWLNHLDFGKPASQSLPHLVGEGRAADIAVNVLLPWAAAWAIANSVPKIVRQSAKTYRLFPKLASNNLIRHTAAQLGLGAKQVNSARRQQGLLHLYHEFCAAGNCRGCLIVSGATNRLSPPESHSKTVSVGSP